MVEPINVGTDDKPVFVDPRGHPKGTKHKLTRDGSHVAHASGYADGRVLAVGDPIPAGYPVAEEWMTPTKNFEGEINDEDPAPATETV